MTKGLVEESGVFQSGDEDVFDGERGIFIAPPPRDVPVLMEDLFSWVKKEKDLDPLILSSVFHHEFVFIHPFSDRNGRMARLWQTALLTKWREIFQYVPIESQIEKNQSGYCKAIADCHSAGKSDIFIEFILQQIDNAFTDILEQASAKEGQISEHAARLLDIMEYDVPYTSGFLMEKLGIKTKDSFRNNYLRPAMEPGLIHMTIPDRPRSRNRRYVKKRSRKTRFLRPPYRTYWSHRTQPWIPERCKNPGLLECSSQSLPDAVARITRFVDGIFHLTR